MSAAWSATRANRAAVLSGSETPTARSRLPDRRIEPDQPRRPAADAVGHALQSRRSGLRHEEFERRPLRPAQVHRILRRVSFRRSRAAAAICARRNFPACGTAPWPSGIRSSWTCPLRPSRPSKWCRTCCVPSISNLGVYDKGRMPHDAASGFLSGFFGDGVACFFGC